MSLWQRPHTALVMKKLAGMVRPRFVFADDGKNGPPGPAPSLSMLSGGVVGLTMRYRACDRRSIATLSTKGTATTAPARTVAPAAARIRARGAAVLTRAAVTTAAISSADPATLETMCAT